MVATTFLSFAGCESTQKRRNIIFLLTDDQRWDVMSCMGNEIIQTSNMDGLANQLLFMNVFVSGNPKDDAFIVMFPFLPVL